jgi:hypothetical protein
MTAETDELEAAIDRLYTLTPAEFTAARNALAGERKSAGDRAGSARVKALVKPTLVAWVVNLLYWKHRGLFDGLVTAMAELAAAQREAPTGAGASALREATRRKTERLQQLVQVAERRLVDAGSHPGPSVLQRVSATLEALATPRPRGAAGAPHAGRLANELQPSGFDVALGLGGLELPPVRDPSREPEAQEAEPTGDEDESRDAAAAHAARLRFQQAEFEVARMRREASAAERALDQAESRLAAATADVAQFEARLAKAREHAEEKGVLADEARSTLARARAGLAAAEGALAVTKQGA